MESSFLHHVFFWLNDPASAADLAQLRAGLEKLKAVATVRAAHLGRPADRSRGVVDSSYSLAWLLVFDDSAGEAFYQTHPLHLAFVAENKHLWSKVMVYDSEAH